MYKYFIFILCYLTNVESFFLFNFKNRFNIKKKNLKLTSSRLYDYDYDFINPILNYQNQNNILKLNNYEKVKSIMNSDNTYAILTILNNKLGPFPYTCLTNFCIDKKGNPIFYFSNNSTLIKKIQSNTKISVCIPEFGLSDVEDSYITFTGNLRVVDDKSEKKNIKNMYLQNKHESDCCNLYILDDIKDIIYNNGLSRKETLSINTYYNTLPDTTYLYSFNVVKGIDNRYNFIIDSLISYLKNEFNLKKYIDYDYLKIKNVDKYGLNLRLNYKNNSNLVTIPFNRIVNTEEELTYAIKYIFNKY